MNSKTKIGSMFLLAAIMVAGTISMAIPKSFAEPGADIQTIKCVNSNVNINGIDIKKGPRASSADEAAANAIREDDQNGQGNGLFDSLNIDRNLVNICVNVNLNEQEDGECEISGTCPL
jgi:hypothetical protein